MIQEIKIDDLFARIDDELIILSEAKQKGEYKWFDFIAALRLLNDRLQNEGYNEYRTSKVSRLVNVFNDLCHTIVQSYSYRILSYDKERKIVTEEWHIFGEDCRVETIEQNVDSELEEYYESLSLPQQELHSGKHLKTEKIKYLLRGCKEDFGKHASIYIQNHEDENLKQLDWLEPFALKQFHLLSEHREDFRNLFAVSLDLDKHKVSFEKYIMQLKAEQNVLNRSPESTFNLISNSRRSDDANVQTAPNAQNIHFSINKSYEEMQRILTALQQQGFISVDTTIETFYFRMTGMGVSTNDKVEWIKKGKKRKSDISKSSLVYFLKIFANYNVDQTSDCKNKIQEIFGMSLPTSTITRSSTCEYKTEIDNIVEVKQ